jgi:hypothetical protein
VRFLHTVSQEAIHSPVNVNIQEGDVTICLSLNGELCVCVDVVKVKEDIIELLTLIGLDH